MQVSISGSTTLRQISVNSSSKGKLVVDWLKEMEILAAPLRQLLLLRMDLLLMHFCFQAFGASF
jgi:hypothetical protein